MPRIACLMVPELSLVAALRAEPQLVAQPLAVVQAGADLGGRAHVLGATPAASGVVPGQTLAEARAICPGLFVRQASAERERAAAQAAREAAGAVSPRVEEAAPGVVSLDAAGLESLIGDERAVGRALVQAAERVGLRAAVGLSSSKPVARLAARAAEEELSLEATRWGTGGGAFRVVPPGEEREVLAALPLHALELPFELHDSLRRFGLHTLGEVARLPPGPLAARLGPDAAALSRLARGEEGPSLSPRKEPERFEEGEELEWDAASVEPLLFVWKGLLDRLAQRLAARGLMAREILLQLRLADASWDERTLDLAAPTREVPALLQLLRLTVEGSPPPAGVRAVRLCAVPVREVLEQMPLFGRRSASPTQLAAAIARLSALVGIAGRRSRRSRESSRRRRRLRCRCRRRRSCLWRPARCGRRARRKCAATRGARRSWSSARARWAAAWWRARDRGGPSPSGGPTRRWPSTRTTWSWRAGSSSAPRASWPPTPGASRRSMTDCKFAGGAP